MTFQVFQRNFYILYVEGDKKSIAENLIYDQQKLFKKMYKYIGEYYSKEIIYKDFSGYFIDGFNNNSYKLFIKQNGLVNLMSNYWNERIKKEIIENKRQRQCNVGNKLKKKK